MAFLWITVATDSQDRVYVFQRTDHPVVVFDHDGNYLNAWGIGAITDPHGTSITNDMVYLTDRSDCVAMTFTLEGKPLQVNASAGHFAPTSLPNQP
jgi:DNA-binding beta-propeller fold protein YncE